MKDKDVVLIPAVVERTSPDRSEYKRYSSDLSFDGKVIVEIPVPSEHVRKEGGKFILSLKGWAIFLDTYTSEVEKMDERYKSDLRSAKPHYPYNH